MSYRAVPSSRGYTIIKKKGPAFLLWTSVVGLTHDITCLSHVFSSIIRSLAHLSPSCRGRSWWLPSGHRSPESALIPLCFPWKASTWAKRQTIRKSLNNEIIGLRRRHLFQKINALRLRPLRNQPTGYCCLTKRNHNCPEMTYKLLLFYVKLWTLKSVFEEIIRKPNKIILTC